MAELAEILLGLAHVEQMRRRGRSIDARGDLSGESWRTELSWGERRKMDRGGFDLGLVGLQRLLDSSAVAVRDCS